MDPEHEKIVNYVHDEIDNASLGDNSVWKFCKDDKGNMWIGTFNAGSILLIVMRLTSSLIFDTALLQQVSSNNKVLCVTQDSFNRIWIGTDGGGLNLFDRQPTSSNITRTNRATRTVFAATMYWLSKKMRITIYGSARGVMVSLYSIRKKTPSNNNPYNSSDLNGCEVPTSGRSSRQRENIEIGAVVWILFEGVFLRIEYSDTITPRADP